ncbi:MAG TPA: 30S ribosomal protein S6 [Candidatus Brocadiia bacterium]|nr:30S ribosomal protein S6 [Planctomycetota bacterium]MDO8092138.1 30S ribosomal protein S6 [Candidatus Brocadiales bacterium]
MVAPHITRKYEGMFLIDNTYANKDWDAVIKQVHEILQKHNAEVVSTEKWGERKLAYKIKGQKRGTYLLIRFNAPTGAITPIKQDCLLSETILRSLIIRDLGLEVLRPEVVEETTVKSETKGPSTVFEGLEEVEIEEIS